MNSEVSIFVESLGLTAVNSVVMCEFVESIEFTAEYTTHNIRMAFCKRVFVKQCRHKCEKKKIKK